MAHQKLELQASSAQTANGNSAPQRLLTAQMIDLGIDITAGSGTVTSFDLWLQVAAAEAGPWFDMPADQVLKSADSGTAETVATNQRDVVDGKNDTNAEQFLAVYKHVPAGYVRTKWKLAGTSPSLTWSATASAK